MIWWLGDWHEFLCDWNLYLILLYLKLLHGTWYFLDWCFSHRNLVVWFLYCHFSDSKSMFRFLSLHSLRFCCSSFFITRVFSKVFDPTRLFPWMTTTKLTRTNAHQPNLGRFWTQNVGSKPTLMQLHQLFCGSIRSIILL